MRDLEVVTLTYEVQKVLRQALGRFLPVSVSVRDGVPAAINTWTMAKHEAKIAVD